MKLPIERLKMYVHFKPRVWCLCCHQAAWDIVGEDIDNTYYCPYCKVNFMYPSKKIQNPVYRFFREED